MSAFITQLFYQTQALLGGIQSAHDLQRLAWRFFPFVLLFELPVQAIIAGGVVRHAFIAARRRRRAPPVAHVGCIVTCYGEGEGVAAAIRSLFAQRYDGMIEIVAVVDGALRNGATLAAAQALIPEAATWPRRSLRVVAKWQRGGRVSSLNAGIALAGGDIIFTLDADTSFDNDMVAVAVQTFELPGTVAVAGNLRARNAEANPLTRMQAIEYALAISLSKTGLGRFNIVNNISGAFGVFRRKLLDDVGGFNSGTAEDLDLTLRIKQYFGRHPGYRIRFEAGAVGHTDVPSTVQAFLKQRLTWDGDLFHMYFRVHRMAFSPRLIGWPNFLALIWQGLFWQMVLPALLFVYTAFGLVFQPSAVASVLPLVYAYYLAITFLTFALYLVAVSERPRDDLRLVPWLPLYPLFGFAARIWSFVAILRDAFFSSYLESPMAPIWVTRRPRW